MTADNDRTDYLLGSTDAERRRLATQHRLWADAAVALWDRARFESGQHVLDLGCGPGFATLDLARRVGPTGRVTAVDRSTRFLEHLRAQLSRHRIDNVEVVCADTSDLELPAESLDGAYSRWLFCYLEAPERTVRAVARALRHGGRLAICDYFNYGAFTFAPRSAALDRVVAAVQRTWRRSGGSLDVQATMPGWMRAAGLEVEEIRPVQRIARPGSELWHWPKDFFVNFMPTLAREAGLTEDEQSAFWNAWSEREADPAAFLALPPMVNVIGRRS